MKVPVGVLLSGSGTNLQALIDACAEPGFPARICVAVANKEDAFGLERARAAGIPTAFVPHQGRARVAFEQELIGVLRERGAEWVACAGFMRVLTPHLLGAFPGRVLNIHPALLPAFPGVNAQGQALDYGVRISGATVHLVDAGTDTGPIVLQGALAVRPDDTESTLKERILALEHRLYPMALRMAVEGRLHLDGRRVRIDLIEGEQTSFWQD